MIDMIKYKANLAGITVIQTNESYTSQTSSLDHEQPCWENGNKSRKRQGKSPVNRRIKRGLFKANDDRLINADINGALQIIRKVFSNFQVNDEIAGVVLRPVKWSPKFQGTTQQRKYKSYPSLSVDAFVKLSLQFLSQQKFGSVLKRLKADINKRR